MASDDDCLALCLSGGGLRATLFHLGVIKAMRCHWRKDTTALESVSEIYSVSGGSILAAHLLRHWDRYVGTNAEFGQVESEVRAFARRNIRDRVVRRWLVLGLFGKGRCHWLQREYGGFAESSIASCYEAAKGRPPELYILATSFKTGELFAFSSHNVEVVRRNEKTGQLETIRTRCGTIDLAYAVAASSAFPPLFPPTRLTRDMVGEAAGDEFDGPLYLSDGGVFDNLGFDKYLARRAQDEKPPETVIVSNAGAPFRTDPKNAYSGIFARNVRASDILMRRVAQTTEVDALELQAQGVTYIPIKIGRPVPNGDLPDGTAERLKAVRTDLDRFDSDLSGMLIDHGFRVAADALAAAGWEPRPPLPPFLSDPAKRDLHEVAERAASRRPWSVVFDRSDAMVLVLWSAAIALLGAVGYVGAKAVNERQAQAVALKARQDEREAELNQRLAQERFASQDLAQRFQSLAADNARLRQQLGVSGRGPASLPASGATEPVDTAAYTVWLQFAGSLSREQMTEFGRTIQQRWPNAPGANRGGERTPAAAGKLEVRYNPVDRTAAEELTRDVLASGLVVRMNPPVPLEIIPPGSLEIWVSN